MDYFGEVNKKNYIFCKKIFFCNLFINNYVIIS